MRMKELDFEGDDYSEIEDVSPPLSEALMDEDISRNYDPRPVYRQRVPYEDKKPTRTYLKKVTKEKL
jgi:hypothetical protein